MDGWHWPRLVAQWGVLMQLKNGYQMTPGVRQRFSKFTNSFIYLCEFPNSLISVFRYKMISNKTWPNFRRGSPKDGTKTIIDELQFSGDVQYGNTKIFIRSPQTVFSLEKTRTEKLNGVYIFIQKVSSFIFWTGMFGIWSTCNWF